MDNTIRAFIAIELSSEIKTELGCLQERLKKSGADVKWANPDGIHLTLKFLGNISASKVPLIKEALENTTREMIPFQIALSKIGVFPKMDSPRVIWAGVDEESDIISEINTKLEKKLEKNGFPEEPRSFRPHLTLGRVKSSKNKEELKKSIEALNADLTPTTKMTISSVALFRSTLTSKGAIYTCLCQASF